MKNIPIEERIIFALDVDSSEKAKQWVKLLEPHIHFYKVGLQLFLSSWFSIVDWIIERGHKVMLDLKFFDIPKTVALAMRQLQDRKITFVTVHGQSPIIRAAVAEKKDLKVLAVTVLTSVSEEGIRELGFHGKIEDLVLRMAKRALELGCDGIVSSGHEAKYLRSFLGKEFYIVTPGIRPTRYCNDDQKRIVGPKDAILNGADYIVVGRPISTAEDPLAMVESMQHAISSALSQLS